MSIALTLAVVALAAIVLVARAKKRAKRDKPVDVFYVCRQCEHPYAIPNVPTRCRRCGGPVDKQFSE
jgi:hypothetical protein